MKKNFTLIFSGLFFISLISRAQVNIYNEGTLYISNATDTIYINGTFINTSTADLNNHGRFYIKQNLSNSQASMSEGTGTLYLNGSGTQTVSGTQVFKTFNLQTNNSGGFTLNNDLSVSGVHTFSSGLIASSTTPNYLVYQAGSSHTGSSDSRHVTGWVKKIGTTSFTFPVGSNTYLRTAGIANLSANSEINCHYYTGTQNIYNLIAPLVKVNANEYWQIDKVSGGTAQIVLNWDKSNVVFDNVLLSEIRVAHYTGGNWTNASGTAAGNVTTTGTITSGSVNTFSPFTFGYESLPVPLKFISFTAGRNTGISYLQWVTDNEENADRFDVQRSDDGLIFTTIGNKPARNTTFQEKYYFEDRSPIQGIAYYRIKSLDIDGKFLYTKIAAVTEGQFQQNSFFIINPVQSAITLINKSGFDGLFEYRLYDAGGKLVLKGNVNIGVNGHAVLPLPVQSAVGIYYLELSNNRTHFRQKILVEK